MASPLLSLPKPGIDKIRTDVLVADQPLDVDEKTFVDLSALLNTRCQIRKFIKRDGCLRSSRNDG